MLRILENLVADTGMCVLVVADVVACDHARQGCVNVLVVCGRESCRGVAHCALSGGRRGVTADGGLSS